MTYVYCDFINVFIESWMLSRWLRGNFPLICATVRFFCKGVKVFIRCMRGKYFIAVFHCESTWPNDTESYRQSNFRPLFQWKQCCSSGHILPLSSVYMRSSFQSLIPTLVGSNLGARTMGSKDKGLFTKNHNLFKSIFCSVLFWCHVSFRVCFYFSLMCLLLLCLLVLEKYPYHDHLSNLRFLWSSHIELYINNNNNIITSESMCITTNM